MQILTSRIGSRPWHGPHSAAHLAVVFVLLTAGRQSAEARQASFGTFAFADDRGTALLALKPWSEPEEAAVALCAGSTRVPVAFSARQTSTSEDDGRARAYNFGNRAGDRFRVTDGTAPRDGSCFIATEPLAAADPVQLRAARGVCSARVTEAVAAARGRDTASCVRIGLLAGARELYAVQFEFRGDSGLAAIVLAEGGPESDLAFLDFAGERDEWGDTWRVGDGGQFNGGDIQPLFAVAGPDGLLLGMGWAGAEGESLILAQRRGDVLERIGSGYRYWVGR